MMKMTIIVEDTSKKRETIGETITLGSVKQEYIPRHDEDNNEYLYINSSFLDGLDLQLPEYKLLFYILAEIKKANDKETYILFPKKSLEKALNVKQIKPFALEKHLSSLMGILIFLQNQVDEAYDCHTHLFGNASMKCNEYGVMEIRVEYNADALRHVFETEGESACFIKPYSIFALKSLYSYYMYLYLTQHSNQNTTLMIPQLKKTLRCEKNKSYNSFRLFNDKILKPCFKEVDEKTECHFDFSEIKQGNYVTAMHFYKKTVQNMTQNTRVF